MLFVIAYGKEAHATDIHSYFQNKKLLITSAVVLLLTPLVPEYISLPMTLILFLWFKPQAKKNGAKVLLGDTGKVLFCFMCYQLLTVIWADNKMYTIAISMMWMGTALAYLMLANGIKSEKILDRFLFIAAISDGIMGFIASIQSWAFAWMPTTPINAFGEKIPLNEFINPFWRIIDRLVFNILPIGILPYSDPSRASSTYNNPLVYASVAVLLLPIALYCAYTMKGKKRLFSIISICFSVAGIVLSKSRGPCIALAIIIVLAILYGWKKGAFLWLCCTPFLFVVINRYLRNFIFSFIGDSSTNTRIDIWEASFEMIKENWFLGLGTGVQNIWDVLNTTYGINQPHAHNIILEFTLEGGIIGILLFLVFCGFFLADMIRLFKISEKGRMLASTFIISMIAFCACGMTDFVFMSPKQLLSFMMMFGLSQAAVRIMRKENNEKTTVEISVHEEKEKVALQ